MKKFLLVAFCSYIAFVCPLYCFADDCEIWRSKLNTIGKNLTSLLENESFNGTNNREIMKSLTRSSDLYRGLISTNCNEEKTTFMDVMLGIDLFMGLIYMFFQTLDVWKQHRWLIFRDQRVGNE
jgi:hypothetical protein